MALLARDTAGLTCNPPGIDSSGFNIDEASSNVQDFCKDAAQWRITSENEQSSLFKTALGNSDLRISISLSNDNSTCQGTEYVLDESTCQQGFYQLVDDCGSMPNDYLGFRGGNITKECGIFSISSEIEEIIQCGGNPYQGSKDMSSKSMDEAIEDYCDQSLLLSPDEGSGSNFQITVPSGQSYNNYMADGVVVRMTAQYNEQGQTSCSPAKGFDTKGEECRRKLTAVKDKCGEQGGGLSETGVNGCVVWTIWGQQLG